ncbi:hypothetical protein [Providencia stuartii]|uniref:hypothetical protein n=1 Tax=Providencia stuartii TaxID=588 RepID=UPI00076B362D|nr:hypothetical protein AL507_03725 [Providencia stuartii]
MSSDEEGKGRVALLKRIGTKVVIAAVKKATGCDVIEDIYDTVADEFRNIYQGIKRDKIYNFYMGIEELSEDEIVLSSDNFAFLIQKLMEDDEVGKAKIYSRLVVNISNSNYEDEDRINFISILSKLSSYELELARKYYIYGNYDLVGYEYRHNQLETLHEPTDGQLLRYTNGLVFNGLIYNPNNRASQKGYYKNTDTLNQFVRLIFDEGELKAESINEVKKERYDILAMEDGLLSGSRGIKFISLMEDRDLSVKIISKKDVKNHLYHADNFIVGINEVVTSEGHKEFECRSLMLFDDYNSIKNNSIDISKSLVKNSIEFSKLSNESKVEEFLIKFADNIRVIKN